MFTNRGMDSKEVVHVYNGILLSHKKEWNNAICSSMDEPRDCHTEWSKSKKNTQYCLYEKSNKSAEMNLSTKQSYRCKNKNKKAEKLWLPGNKERSDCSPPGFSIHGIFQANVLEWVSVSFSRGSSWPRDRTWVSRIAGRCFTGWPTRENKEGRGAINGEIVIDICTLLYIHVCALSLRTCLTLQPHGLKPARLFCPWDSPGKNTGGGCHALLQGNLPDPGIESMSPALAADSLPLAQPGKPIAVYLKCIYI